MVFPGAGIDLLLKHGEVVSGRAEKTPVHVAGLDLGAVGAPAVEDVVVVPHHHGRRRRQHARHFRLAPAVAIQVEVEAPGLSGHLPGEAPPLPGVERRLDPPLYRGTLFPDLIGVDLSPPMISRWYGLPECNAATCFQRRFLSLTFFISAAEEKPLQDTKAILGF